MSTAQALNQTLIAIHMYSSNPSVENLVYLHQSLFVTKSILPQVSIVQQVPPPKERITVPRILGDNWQTVGLDRFYQRLIKTCMGHASAQTVAVRIQTTPYVFTEVLIGRILLPLQLYFEQKVSSFEHAYTSVTEPIFLYFASTEGKPYNPEDAFRSVRLRGMTNDDAVFLISILDTYDTSRFRTSTHKGNVHIMFNPTKTRSARDLTRDFYIERFNAVRADLVATTRGKKSPTRTRPTSPILQFQASRPSTPESDNAHVVDYEEDETCPDVVSGVIKSVFGDAL